MNFLESIKMAFSSLTINKFRSFLTMLGIIIGISAVITITTIGNSIQKTLTNTFDSLGVNSLEIYLSPRDDYEGDEYYITDDDIMTLEMVNGLINAHPDELMLSVNEEYGSASIVNENGETFSALLRGITDSTFSDNATKKQIIKGRSIIKSDCEKLKHTCLVSDIFVNQYFKNPDDAIGSTITFAMESGENVKFTIVGIMEYTKLENKQLGFDTAKSELDKKTVVFIPYDTMIELQGIAPNKKEIDYASICWSSKCNSETAKGYISDYFGELYAENEMWYIEVYDPQNDLGLINTVLTVITVAISVIAAISLIVGGVGVMNIMLVSILERTREIGVRKALGALNSDIRRQFVIEAVIICLLGGLIGVILGIANGFILSTAASALINSMYAEYAEYISLTVSPSVPAILISLGFSMITGLIFGYYPAKRAGNMNPIDALRYE